MRRSFLLSASAVLFATATCTPDLGPSDSLITSARLLAIRAVPAEAAPGTPVTFTSLVVGPSGAISGASIRWDFCTAPRPLTDDNVVSNACLDSSSLAPAGGGPSVTATTPHDGCSRFGPDSPPGGFRPTDPDITGGYYQPLRADLAGASTSLALAFALIRIHCDLANAPAAAATTFASAYKLNENPTLLPVSAEIQGVPASLDAIPAGARVAFTASWPATAAETFAYFEPASQAVTSQRESMHVAWYSTAGAFDTESTGRASTDLATTTTNTWTAPTTPGTAWVFLVLRDSRGGVDFANIELVIAK